MKFLFLYVFLFVVSSAIANDLSKELSSFIKNAIANNQLEPFKQSEMKIPAPIVKSLELSNIVFVGISQLSVSKAHTSQSSQGLVIEFDFKLPKCHVMAEFGVQELPKAIKSIVDVNGGFEAQAGTATGRVRLLIKNNGRGELLSITVKSIKDIQILKTSGNLWSGNEGKLQTAVSWASQLVYCAVEFFGVRLVNNYVMNKIDFTPLLRYANK